MLVLSRKVRETIVIDGHIVLTVLRVQGGKVRIGIQAPAEVQVLRGELIDQQRAEPGANAVSDAA